MAKGYMIFVEGGECPQAVHADFASAMWQMRFLAEKNPGKQVLLFHLHKRCTNQEGVHTPLPCHIPSDFKHPERLKLDRLVYKKDLNEENAE